jgi:transposase, IS30 family
MERDNSIGYRREGKHLTKEERVVIERMLRAGYPALSIAATLCRHRRTIEREIVRGCVEHWDREWRTMMVYSSDRGQDVHDLNATARGPDLKLGDNRQLVEFVRIRIIEHRESPAVVAFRMRAEGLPGAVCTKTLYSYIDQGLIKGVCNESLWEKRKRHRHARRTLRRFRSVPTRRQSIEKRPAHVDTRNDFGHWEIDLICGPNASTATLMTLVERKTRKLIMRKLPDKTHRAVRGALNGIERHIGPVQFRHIFKSITADNGTEFLDVDGLQNSVFSTKQRTALFYAHPYASWERGTNENTNRIIRRFIAKGRKIEALTRQTVVTIESWINNYPRRSIDFRSPDQCFDAELKKLVA